MIINPGEQQHHCGRPGAEHPPARGGIRAERRHRRRPRADDQYAEERERPAMAGAALVHDGVGEVLALTITLETGDIGRFAHVGNFTSYCRCVGSEKLSNGKKKGQGNSKNGNKYLAWAFVEAANFAIRFNEQAKRFYQRKAAKRNRVVALKAVAHKLARASYYVMRDQVPFDSTKLFV